MVGRWWRARWPTAVAEAKLCVHVNDEGGVEFCFLIFHVKLRNCVSHEIEQG